MQQDPLQAAWQNMATGQRSNAELGNMLQTNVQPELRRIKKQLLFEAACFAVFLMAYYTMFDGNKKPLYVNVLLVLAFAFALVHNIMGYYFTLRPLSGDNIRQSLQHQLSKMKAYSLTSITSRLVTAACLLLFFTSTITFTTQKYWLLIGLVAILLVQLALLGIVWLKRIRRLQETISLFP